MFITSPEDITGPPIQLSNVDTITFKAMQTESSFDSNGYKLAMTIEDSHQRRYPGRPTKIFREADYITKIKTNASITFTMPSGTYKWVAKEEDNSTLEEVYTSILNNTYQSIKNLKEL